jgi:hypothetical protein
MQKSGYAEERICRRADMQKSGYAEERFLNPEERICRRADMQKSEKYRLTKEEMNKT